MYVQEKYRYNNIDMNSLEGSGVRKKERRIERRREREGE